MIDFPRYNYSARLVRVIDGDTIEVNIDLGFSIHFTTKVRLLGLDTPEMIGANRARAIAAREVLKAMLENQEINLRTTKTDKYGRYLAEIWIDKTNVNQWLITNGFAVAYYGGAK